MILGTQFASMILTSVLVLRHLTVVQTATTGNEEAIVKTFVADEDEKIERQMSTHRGQYWIKSMPTQWLADVIQSYLVCAVHRRFFELINDELTNCASALTVKRLSRTCVSSTPRPRGRSRPMGRSRFDSHRKCRGELGQKWHGAWKRVCDLLTGKKFYQCRPVHWQPLLLWSVTCDNLSARMLVSG